jgi:Flp pilus assembly protein CpaB
LKRSNRLILLIGVFLAALAFVFVIVLLGGGAGGLGGGVTPSAAPPVEADTVVATRDIPLGVTVTAAMVNTQKLLITVQEPGAYGAVSQAIGKVARQTITKGQQVTSLQFSDSGSTTQIECLAGFTCIAVQVDQVSGVGTLIKSGDFVDIIAGVGLAFPLLDGEVLTQIPPENYDPTSVKVLIQGVQVVATLLPPPPAPAAVAAGATPAPESGTALNGQQEIVIIAVTPQQAEVIKFTQLDGNITLALRSPKDFVDESGNPVIPVTVITSGIVLKTMIDDWGVLPPLPIIIPAATPLP